jgi:hypothetical protein
MPYLPVGTLKYVPWACVRETQIPKYANNTQQMRKTLHYTILVGIIL